MMASDRLTLTEKYVARQIVIDGQLAQIKRLLIEMEAKGIDQASYKHQMVVINSLQRVIIRLKGQLKAKT